jgi:hypothetical protein
MSGKDDVEGSRRNYGGPYTAHHPIPTIQKYREEKKARVGRPGDSAGEERVAGDEEDFRHEAEHATDASRDQRASGLDQKQNAKPSQQSPQDQDDTAENKKDDESQAAEDTSEATADAQDPKQQRKQMKKRGDERAEREVGEIAVRSIPFPTNLRVSV